MIKLDKKLLISLYEINHSYQEEYNMMNFILNYCKNLKNVTFEFDHYFNLFITKNTNNPDFYPCIIAHTDEIKNYSKSKNTRIENGIIYGYEYNKYGNKVRCGLGADDANGIYAALELLKNNDDIKICFTIEEESGGGGAEQASLNIDFFSNCSYLLQADRRGSSELITFTNGITTATKEFINELTPSMDKYEYVEGVGTFTDVGILVESLEICGVNISCGYKNEHTYKECTNLHDLENCVNFMNHIINNVPLIQYDIKIESLFCSKYWSIDNKNDGDIIDYYTYNDTYPSFANSDDCDLYDLSNSNYVNPYDPYDLEDTDPWDRL